VKKLPTFAADVISSYLLVTLKTYLVRNSRIAFSNLMLHKTNIS